MDLGKDKTDSGLLNEIRDLMSKRTIQKPKKENSDYDFDQMIKELEDDQGKRSREMPIPQMNTKPAPSPASFPTQKPIPEMNFSSPTQNQPTIQDMYSKETRSNGFDDLPSFGSMTARSQKIQEPIYTEKPFIPNRIPQDMDILVPAPPPELMQEKTPRIDVERLINVEEIYLNHKGKDKYGDFKIKKEIDTRKPIFIKVENYEKTLMRMIETKANVLEFSEILFRLENLHDSQSSNFSTLHNQLEDIQRKMIFIDTLIFEKL